MTRLTILCLSLLGLAAQAKAVAVIGSPGSLEVSTAKADRLPLVDGLETDMPDVATIAIVSSPGHTIAIRVPLLVVSFDYE